MAAHYCEINTLPRVGMSESILLSFLGELEVN